MIRHYFGSPKEQKRKRRHRKIRGKMSGTIQRPRVYVFKSLKHIYAHVYDDTQGLTIMGVSDLNLSDDIVKDKTKKEIAYSVGELVGQKLQEQKIGAIVFDRGGNKYHGRVQQLAEGIRKSGITF